MTNELCPNCRVLTDAVVSMFEKEIKEKGEVYNVISRSYNCSMCNTFIRCENIKSKYKKD
ncbi:hypothetical protein [Clostridium lacusfryxellense]|uniref:hypothetical protein n=1 Tax=Clostridium lacusfryxellense TaxID=205328 RepID=UPI001C0B69F2|nr:hypothetical protein [Clostridium lacusfryxellense]MBU3112593.1 hypothetical protein [Clostridium lacusfryxellense]